MVKKKQSFSFIYFFFVWSKTTVNYYQKKPYRNCVITRPPPPSNSNGVYPSETFFSDLRFSVGFLDLQGKTAHHVLPWKRPTQTQTNKPVWNFWNEFEGGGSGNYTITVIWKKPLMWNKTLLLLNKPLMWNKILLSSKKPLMWNSCVRGFCERSTNSRKHVPNWKKCIKLAKKWLKKVEQDLTCFSISIIIAKQFWCSVPTSDNILTFISYPKRICTCSCQTKVANFYGTIFVHQYVAWFLKKKTKNKQFLFNTQMFFFFFLWGDQFYLFFCSS